MVIRIWRIKATGYMAHLDVVTYGESTVLDAIKQVGCVGIDKIRSVVLREELGLPPKYEAVRKRKHR